MKFGFLQGDFSSGELSPRAQGHTDSDAYKAGLKLASNCAPTRTGSIASRAGLRFRADGFDAHTGGAANLPVQHIPIHDGPYGDFVVEISPTGIRLMDRGGLIPWNCPPTRKFVQFTAQDGSFAYGDPESRSVYLRSEVATGVRSYFLSKGTGSRNAIVDVGGFGGIPTWTLSGKISGDGLTAHIVQSPSANFQDIALNPDASGNFSVTFTPNIVVGFSENFYVELRTGAGTQTTVIWDIQLVSSAAVWSKDTTTAVRLGTTPLAPAVFNGVNQAPTQERIRAEAFWANGDFWVAFAGGTSNAYSGFCLRWANTVGVVSWEFGCLPCTPNSLAQIVGANTVAVFQDRVWYGVNLDTGKRVIRASLVGFGTWFNMTPPAGSTNTRSNSGGNWLFQFIVETVSRTLIAGDFAVFAAPCGAVVFFTFPCLHPKSDLIVTVQGQVRLEVPDWQAAGAYFGYEAAPDSTNLVDIITANPVFNGVADQTLHPGGFITFSNNGNAPQIGHVVTITRVAQATDPLDLTLASPAGQLAWINVLRGLLLGTTRGEKLFDAAAELAVDPATGQSPSLRDESNYGADLALAALNVNEHVLFTQRGRKVLRLAGINISSNGGLVSEDVGVAGEHLTKARIRSMCFLKSPVQRVVFAFDDGTGAVMTIVNRGTGLARTSVPSFSRFSIPSCFGGIYSVASLDGEYDSELWVGTENGATLWAAAFESDVSTRLVDLPNAVPAAPTHLVYDIDNPLPPVMDGWIRCPLINQGGAQYATGLPASTVGKSAYALINGQVRGPYTVTAGGKVTFEAALALDKFWVDATGARRAQEVYVGLLFPEHRWTSLPLEGGNPVGTAQNLTSRKPQLHLRLVDSYLPLVNGKRLAERGPSDETDVLGGRVTGDRRATEEGFQRGSVVDVVMDLPLRMEVAAIFGGVVMNNL